MEFSCELRGLLGVISYFHNTLWVRLMCALLVISSRRHGFTRRAVHVGFVVNKVAMGDIFLRNFACSPVKYYSSKVPYSFNFRWMDNGLISCLFSPCPKARKDSIKFGLDCQHLQLSKSAKNHKTYKQKIIAEWVAHIPLRYTKTWVWGICRFLAAKNENAFNTHYIIHLVLHLTNF
jgi:hypothetical protein